jgi:hypothetical protein
MFALLHDEFGLKSPLSQLMRSPGFWFLIAGAADAAIVVGGFAGLAAVVVLAIAGAIFWPRLERLVRSW